MPRRRQGDMRSLFHRSRASPIEWTVCMYQLCWQEKERRWDGGFLRSHQIWKKILLIRAILPTVPVMLSTIHPWYAIPRATRETVIFIYTITAGFSQSPSCACNCSGRVYGFYCTGMRDTGSGFPPNRCIMHWLQKVVWRGGYLQYATYITGYYHTVNAHHHESDAGVCNLFWCWIWRSRERAMFRWACKKLHIQGVQSVHFMTYNGKDAFSYCAPASDFR